MRRIALFVTLLSASLAGAPTPARAQMDFEGDITSLTGAREAEMLATYAFARERPRMYAPVSLLHLPLSPYTEMDDEAPWSETRVDAALQYSRYVFGHCGIVLDRGPLQRAPRADMEFPNEKHLRSAGHGETLVYFVDDVPGRSIGFLDASRTKYPFPAARVQNGVPLLTVLPHLIGLRLDATVSAERSSMMLNDRTVQEAFGSALTGAAGFFDPRRFGFADEACNVMREALLRETQCYPRAYVYGGRGDDRWQRYTYPERRAGRRADIPWPLGETPPDDLVVAPAFAQDGLIIFALQGDRWRGFFWRYDDPSRPDPTYAPRAEVYEGFAEPGALGLGVHPAGQDIRLLTFAEGTAVEVHSTPWQRRWPGKKAPRPVQTDRVPCRVMLTSGPVGKGAERPLAVVCNDKVWRLWKTRAPEAFALPRPARWASMTRRCDDDAQLWLGVDDAPGGLELWRVPAYGPLEPEPLPAWAAWPAVREVPFSATWGGTPRSLDRVNIRRFDATQTPRWLPAVNEPTPTPVDATTQWVRYEDLHGPGWVGYVNGRLRVE
jgi:hypothetical protein